MCGIKYDILNLPKKESPVGIKNVAVHSVTSNQKAPSELSFSLKEER